MSSWGDRALSRRTPRRYRTRRMTLGPGIFSLHVLTVCADTCSTPAAPLYVSVMARRAGQMWVGSYVAFNTSTRRLRLIILSLYADQIRSSLPSGGSPGDRNQIMRLTTTALRHLS